ncbi:MAG TPA: MurR/RpiR family transcriptional regulator [Firmicutes bacterium]|nr:MurR/RpiR family transcriptional regulator [Bacillota bacterium]
MLSIQPRESGILSLVERLKPDLSVSQLRIADYILAHTQLQTLSIDEIRKACDVSKATVVRFCQALGYDGFVAFKDALIAELIYTDAGALQSEIGSKTASSGSADMFEQLVASIRRTRQLIDDKAFRSAVLLAGQARTLVWVGAGDSGNLVASGDHRMMINGINSRCVKDPQGLTSMAKILTRNDALIVVSRSGRTPTVIEPLRYLRKQSDCPVIAITGDPGSPLAKMAEICLVSAPIDLYVEEQRTTMQTAQMYLLDAFINSLLREHFSPVRVVGG